MKNRIKLNHHRDIPMLIHIWKWKVANTASLHFKFFSGLSTTTTYNRLTRLKTHGFIQIKTAEDGHHPVWMLDKKGFQVIKTLLPELKEEGFKSENIVHDLFCSAAHLGEFTLETPKTVQFITEQQLRRYHLEDLPAWVPSPEAHRPDGYWRFENEQGATTVSLELERSRKSSSALEKLINFYSEFSKNFYVLWIVNGLGLQKRLIHCLEKKSSASRIHNIIQLKDFLKKGWASSILYGPHIKFSFAEFIYDKARAKPELSLGQGLHEILLEKHLRYRNQDKNGNLCLNG